MTFLQRAKELVAKMTLDEKMSQMRYDSPAIERLGIPAYNWWNECLHGVARSGRATVFPQAIGMASSFDTDYSVLRYEYIPHKSLCDFKCVHLKANECKTVIFE